MAWTAPASYSVAEIVTAAKLNTHIRDNFDYLKGNAGAVDIVAAFNLKPAAANPEFGMYLPASSNVAQYVMYDETSTYRAIAGFGGSTYATTALRNSFFFLTNGASGDVVFMPNGVETARYKPGGAAQFKAPSGGMLYLSAAAVVGSVVTLAAAGTVTSGAIVIINDRNNGTGANLIGGPIMLGLAGATNTAGTDTITTSVTAGGAITVQRTAGTQTHDLNVWALYR